MTKSIIFNFANIDEITIQEVMEQLNRLKIIFPQIFEKLEYVGIKDGLNDVYATTQKTNKFIYLNQNYFSNRDSFLRELDLKTREGFFLEGCNSIGAVISHEFGHIIHNSYLLDSDSLLVPIYIEGKKNLLSKNPPIGSVADIMGRWIHHGFLPNISAKYVINQKNSIKRKREAFAESFSSSIHTPKSKWEPAVHLIIKLIAFIEDNKKYSIKEAISYDNSKKNDFEIIKKKLFSEFGIDLDKIYEFRLG